MLTNKHNLPEAFRNFEKRNPHTSGGADYTVTTLIDSPRISSLKELHGDEVDEDVSDRIMAILGTAVHKILETGVGYGETPEQRFHTEVGGVEISGQVDLQTECSNGVLLSDYKTTSAFVVQKFPHGKPEHERQLNTYAYLARRNGVKVSGLEVVAIIRDWSDGNARRSSEYPENPVVRIPIRMWDKAEAEEYVIGRVALIGETFLEQEGQEVARQQDGGGDVHPGPTPAGSIPRRRAARRIRSLRQLLHCRSMV